MDWTKALRALFDFIAWLRAVVAKQAGRDAERADALEKNREGLQTADAAREEAEAKHKSDPTDGAFDNSFRRD